MGLISNLISGAIGYGISEGSKSHPLRDLIDEKINSSKPEKTLRDIITEYAQAHGIYTNDNHFAHELHLLAEEYEDFDYDMHY